MVGWCCCLSGSKEWLKLEFIYNIMQHMSQYAFNTAPSPLSLLVTWPVTMQSLAVARGQLSLLIEHCHHTVSMLQQKSCQRLWPWPCYLLLQFFSDADDVDTWMLDMLRLVSSEDVGHDEASVQSLVKKHKVHSVHSDYLDFFLQFFDLVH